MPNFIACHLVKREPVKQILFQGGEKAFHPGVVKAASGASHALPELVMSEGISVFPAGILAAPVRMQNQTGPLSETADSVMKSGNTKPGLFMLPHRKSNDGAVETVQNGGKIQLPVFAFHLRNVGEPLGIGIGCFEITPNQVFAELVGRIAFCDAMRAFTTLEQVVFPAELIAGAIARAAFGRQPAPKTSDSVAAVFFPNLFQGRYRGFISGRSGIRLFPSIIPFPPNMER